MKCTKCGTECREGVKFCTQCGNPLDNEEAQAQTCEGEAADASETKKEEGAKPATGQPDTSQPAGAATFQSPPYQALQDEPKPKKNVLKVLIGVIVVVVIIAIAGLAYVKMSAKDPKQVVIDAFKGVYPKGAVSPSEELFGLKEFADSALKTDREGGMTIKLESCSDPSVNAVAGSGIRLESKEDRTNDKSYINMGLIYNGMDLVNFDAYYGDNTMMMAVPELSSKVFTVDLGKGLADRMKNSPTVGPFLSENGVDMDALSNELNQLIAQRKAGDKGGKAPFDIKALLNRYKEGCKAQDNLKAAMTVMKAGRGVYTMNGKEAKCQGYDVVISKDAMIDFLRTSSDFFLQDATLKDDYLKQLEATVTMSKLMSGITSGTDFKSAQEMQKETYDEAKDNVDKMITYLDKSLTDVKMTVYVDKKGNLAAVDASTSMAMKDVPDMENGNVAVTCNFELQGGTYPTQNVKGGIVLTGDDKNTVKIDLLKKGTYDGKKLTGGLSLDISAPDNNGYKITYTGTYDSKDGSYGASAKVDSNNSKILEISAAGAIDDLKKGKSFHMNIDSLKIETLDNSMNLVLNGELYSRPLSGEVEPLKGTDMDVLAATKDDWNSLFMEIVKSAMGLAKQLNIPLY